MRATLELMQRVKDPNIEEALEDLNQSIRMIEKYLSWEYDALSNGEYDQNPPSK